MSEKKREGGRSEMWRTEKEGDGTDGKQKHVHRRRDDPLFFLWLLLLPCSFSYLPNPLPPSLSRSHSTLPRSHGTPKGNAHESSSPRCKQAHLHLTIDLVHQSVPPLPPPQDKEGYHRLGRKQNRVDLYIGCSLEEVGKAFYCQDLHVFPSWVLFWY